ncbi:MAG: hypothetical protein BYD32DRAFT_465968 [Podila humilis]|nr:MAG: hypothetical protein BYD32DRAFT_465968 [Podila humilis]
MGLLVVPEGGNSLGGLCRTTTLADQQHWTCQQHGNQGLPSGTLEALVSFVQGLGGHVDIRRASLSMDLRSMLQAEQLCSLIKNTEKRVDASITLGWDASRWGLDDLLRDLADAKVQNVTLDGVTHSMHPRGGAEYGIDLITDHISFIWELHSVTLLDHPHPQEQYIYFHTFLPYSVYKLHCGQLCDQSWTCASVIVVNSSAGGYTGE